eukprot:6193938-Pleurochrysis_carterae.AAC.1
MGLVLTIQPEPAAGKATGPKVMFTVSMLYCIAACRLLCIPIPSEIMTSDSVYSNCCVSLNGQCVGALVGEIVQPPNWNCLSGNALFVAFCCQIGSVPAQKN